MSGSLPGIRLILLSKSDIESMDDAQRLALRKIFPKCPHVMIADDALQPLAGDNLEASRYIAWQHGVSNTVPSFKSFAAATFFANRDINSNKDTLQKLHEFINFFG